MGILGLGRKKKVVEVEPEPEPVRERSGPALMLLIPEVAGGGTSYRALPFDFIEDAAAHLEAMLPAAVPAVHAFWAMMDHPGDSSASGEALVLMRSEPGSDLVYAVSFVDIESALSFARFEVKRGMHPGQVMVYWAELVTISRSEDGIRLTPEQAPAITPGAMTTLAVSPQLEKARRRQEEEKARLQAELEEIRRRQAQTEELRRRQAEVDDKRKQLDLAEKQRRQTKAEEQRRLREEAREIERLRAEAEELRERQAEAEEHERQEAQARRLRAEQEQQARLQAKAEEEERLRAELEEIERRQAEAEEHERQANAERAQRAEEDQKRRQTATEEMIRLQAEAEDLAMQLNEELRLLAQEEKGRRNAERQAKPRLQAEAELTRMLQEELLEIKRKQAEAEERWHQEAEGRRLQVEAEEAKRRGEEEERRRVEAEEAKRIQEELAQIKRQQAEAIAQASQTEEDENRRQAEAERAGRLEEGLQEIRRREIEAQERWRQEAQERRLLIEAEEAKRRDEEEERRRQEAEETKAIQAKLEEIRVRLSQAQTAPPEAAAELAAAEGAEDSLMPPGREGGVTTNWVRRSPKAPEDAYGTAGEPADAPGTPDETAAPAREFSLNPEVNPPAPAEQPETPEEVTGHQPAASEPPVREFSLDPLRSPPLWALDPETASATDKTEDSPPDEFPPELAEAARPAERHAADGPPLPNAEDDSPALEPVEMSQPTEAPGSDEFPFADEEPLVAEPPPYLRDHPTGDSPLDVNQESADAPSEEPITSRFEVTLEPKHEVEQIVEPPADDEWPADEEWPPQAPVEETVSVATNGASGNGLHETLPDESDPPETIPGEEDLSPEMAAFLRSRRRDKKDNPFRGFESPPGRF